MKSVIKLETQSIKTINFLGVCITLNYQILSTNVFSKPTEVQIYIDPKSCHPEHMIKNIAKLQLLRLQKIYSDTSGYIQKSSEYSNFSIKQGYECSKLKVLPKDMLAKTHDKLQPKAKRKDKKGYNLTSTT